jgi:hypothetical protein
MVDRGRAQWAGRLCSCFCQQSHSTHRGAGDLLTIHCHDTGWPDSHRKGRTSYRDCETEQMGLVSREAYEAEDLCETLSSWDSRGRKGRAHQGFALSRVLDQVQGVIEAGESSDVIRSSLRLYSRASAHTGTGARLRDGAG